MAQPRGHGGLSLTSRIQSGLSTALSVSHGPNSTAASSGNQLQPGVKRKSIGGRGREWAHKCHKLLETMLELEDSKPFRNPVDTFKYPNYYSIVREPMDLSKVMVKLHLGQYATLQDFGKDVQLIFSNWKKYIQDPTSQIYMQIHRLCWWFDLEFKQIVDAPHRSGPHNKKPRHSDPMSSSERGSDSLSHMENQQSANSSGTLPTSTISTSSHDRLHQLRWRLDRRSRERTPHSRSQSGNDGGNKDLENVMGSQRQQLNQPNNQQNGPPNQDSSGNKQKQTSSTAGGSSHSETNPAPEQSSPNQGIVASSTNPSSSQSTSSDTGTGQEQSTKANSKQPQLELHMEATNIWFGPCRSKPMKPVVLNEEGFIFYLRKEEGEVSFHIGVKDIVRCVGHLGPTKKHTLFVFISPSCEKHLKELTKENQVFGSRPKGDPCSLIAIFIHGLLPAQVSKLLHIFWIMGKHSIFGQLFSEVDQKGALTLLANIKPQILERVAEKQHESDKSGPGEASGSHERDSGVALPDREGSGTERPRCTSTSTTSGSQNNSGVSVAAETTNCPTSQTPSETGFSNESPVCSVSQNTTSGSTDHTPSSPHRETGVTCTPLHFPLSSLVPNHVPQVDPVQTDPETNVSSWQFIPDAGPENTGLRTIPAVSGSFDHTTAGQQNGPGFYQEQPPSAISTSSVNLVEDDDLEIVIPSDDDDDSLAFTGRGEGSTLNEMGDDLVMTATRVSIKCPITQQTMKCPMKNQLCGHAYDLDGVLQLIANRAGKAKCPVPGCQNPNPLDRVNLQHDWSLRELIDSKAKQN